MTVGQKASLSLLVAVLLFAAFAVAAFSGLFNILEARFYDPAISRQYSDNLSAVAKATEVWNSLNFSRFAAALETPSVKRSFLPNMSAQDSFDRANALGKLQADTPGLAGIRIIDLDGKRIHFSSFPTDILKKSDTSILFRDYGTPDDLPFARFDIPAGSKGIFRVDETGGRLFYALPVADESALRRGTAVFYLSPAGLMDYLVKAGLVQVGDSIVPAGSAGVLFRAPLDAQDSLASRVAEAWSQGLGKTPLTLSEASSASSWTLLSATTPGGFRLGLLLPASTFTLPMTMKVILLVAFFLTAYLLLFLLLNLRQDKSTIVAERIKRYQIGMLEASFDEKVDRDLARFKRRLESRRSEFREGIKADLGRLPPREEAEADALIDKSWDEIIAVLDRRVSDQGELGSTSLKEIERLIKEALGKASFVLPASALVSSAPAPASAPSPARAAAPVPATPRAAAPKASAHPKPPPPPSRPSPVSPLTDEVEEVEDLEEAEAVEEVEELEEAEAVEEVEELEEAEEAEAVEEVEELEEAEPVEAVDEVEELEEAEAVEEVEELEEAEAVEEVEELEEAEPVEAVEEVEELEEAEAVEEVEELEEAEAVEEVEELEEAEPVEAVEEEELEELESVEGEGPRNAYAPMAIDDDLIPVIPEASILELADSADIGELMAFFDTGTAEPQPLDLVELDQEGEDEGAVGGGVDFGVGAGAEGQAALTGAAKAAEASALEADAIEAELSEFAEGLSEAPPEMVEEIDVILDAPVPFSSAPLDEGQEPVFKLQLSNLDLSSLSDMDSILDQLGDLMAEEVGAALPEGGGAMRSRDPVGSDVNSGTAYPAMLDMAEDGEELPAELLPAAATFRSLGLSFGHLGEVWAASRPVEGFLPLADEAVQEVSLMENEEVLDEDSASGEGLDEDAVPGEPTGPGPIRLREGIYTIEVGEMGTVALDPDLKYLVDSVIDGNRRQPRATGRQLAGRS